MAGPPHRADLASGILVKNTHLRFVRIPEAVERLAPRLRDPRPIEVEVRSQREALEAVDAGADALLVDNASPDAARSIVRSPVRAPARGRSGSRSRGVSPRRTLGRYRRVRGATR